MATFYLDPVGGNDANDGLSFANRWKTFTSGATFARIAAGDTIRIIESPVPVDLGNADWENGNGVVTLATGANKLVDALDGTGWVGVTNSTPTAGNSSLVAKSQANYLNIAIASAFTTGKMAYKDLGAPVDLSAYQRLSFWFQCSSASPTINMFLDLCSDTTGDTPIVSLQLPVHSQSTVNEYRAIVLDNGAPLPSNVRSIAFRTATDPGTVSFRYENLVACKAAGQPTLTHNSIFGKNTVAEPWWYTIHKITDNTVTLGGGFATLFAGDVAKPYLGVTETAKLWAREPEFVARADTTLNKTGSIDSPIVISGGWNATDMSTQSGETWWTGGYWSSTFLNSIGSINFIHIENMGVVGYRTGLGECNNGWRVNLLGMLGVHTGIVGDSLRSTDRAEINIQQVWGMSGQFFNASALACPHVKIGRFHGGTETSTALPKFGDTNSLYFFEDIKPTLQVDLVTNNAGTLFDVSSVPLQVYNTVTDATNQADMYISRTGRSKFIEFINCTLGSPSKFNSTLASSTDFFNISETNIGGDPTAHRRYQAGAFFETVTDEVHTPGGVSWSMQMLLNARDAFSPAKFKLASVAVEANKLVTVKCWCQKNNANIGGGLMIDGHWPGLTRTQVPMSATLNTWEEVTLTFTPTMAGVIPIYAYGVGDINHRILFGDLTITQAD